MYLSIDLLNRTYMSRSTTYRHWSYPTREVGRAATTQQALMACTNAASTASQSYSANDPAAADSGGGAVWCTLGLLSASVFSAAPAVAAATSKVLFMKSSFAFVLVDHEL